MLFNAVEDLKRWRRKVDKLRASLTVGQPHARVRKIHLLPAQFQDF
jgi:hypothetical protein